MRRRCRSRSPFFARVFGLTASPAQVSEQLKALYSQQLILAQASQISWADSNQMIVPERRAALDILREMHEERKKATAARSSKVGARMRTRQ